MALLGVSALEKALLLEAAPLLVPSSSSSFPGKINLPFSPSPSLQIPCSLFSLFIIIFFSIINLNGLDRSFIYIWLIN